MYPFRPDRVEYHISARLKKMAILLHQDCLKPSLKEVPYPAMPLIESLRIDTVQLPHAYRKISVGCINEQMVMIVHQAVGVAEPIVPKSTRMVPHYQEGIWNFWEHLFHLGFHQW
jgi:hypothetical protein